MKKETILKIVGGVTIGVVVAVGVAAIVAQFKKKFDELEDASEDDFEDIEEDIFEDEDGIVNTEREFVNISMDKPFVPKAPTDDTKNTTETPVEADEEIEV